MKACPTGVLERKEDGNVKFHEDLCNGCGECVDVCLIGAISLDGNEKAVKKQLKPEEMVDAIIREDDSRGVFNSLVGCLFARGVYTNENIIDALGAIGIEKTLDDLGKRIFEEKYRFKRREGFNIAEIKVPKRFYETITTMGMVDPKTVETMLEIYRERRGW